MILFLTAFLTARHILPPVFFPNRINDIRDAVLHLIRVVHVSVHREGGGGVTEAHLYLLRADFALGKKRRVRMAERMKADVGGKPELTFQTAKDACHRCERHGTLHVVQSAEYIGILRHTQPLPEKLLGERILPREEILHGGVGECDRAHAALRLGCPLIFLFSVLARFCDVNARPLEIEVRLAQCNNLAATQPCVPCELEDVFELRAGNRL